MTTEKAAPLTYGSYLRVPELLALQTPLSEPPVHDETLFIILQQSQELWFKQILHDLHLVVRYLEEERTVSATRLLHRVTRILEVLGQEVEVMETLPPEEFQHFRHVLKSSSGFESEQFRELELASGLRDEAFLRLASHLLDVEEVQRRWPVTLRDAFLRALHPVHPDPIQALVQLYSDSECRPDLYDLAEAMADYELRFRAWRFHHGQLVERVIGDRAPGTGGSAGRAYLIRTLDYRFVPELWEARNRLSAGESRG